MISYERSKKFCPRYHRVWTEKEDALLKEHTGAKTCREIAALIGRSAKAVEHRYQALKVRKVREYGYEMLPSEILAYAAGIVDGEGHVSIRRTTHYYAVSVSVSNSSKRLTDFLLKYFEGSCNTGKRPNRKPYHRWNIAANQAVQFLKAIYPYLVIKQDQADLVMQFRNELDETKWEDLFQRMKELHHA